jgi:hypothetical protein
VERDSTEYFRLREKAERAAADAATSDRAKSVHQRLAREYAARASEAKDAASPPDAVARPKLHIIGDPA